MLEGWKCPQCGKINAPWKESCDCVCAPRYPWQVPIVPHDPYVYPDPPPKVWWDQCPPISQTWI